MVARAMHLSLWEKRQEELWDRIFSVTQDVVTLAGTLDDSPGQQVLRSELVQSAMAVGVGLVRANAAQSVSSFDQCIDTARLQAIETDYWLRMVYVMQDDDAVQRDLSSVIAQYASIISLLQQFERQTKRPVVS